MSPTHALCLRSGATAPTRLRAKNNSPSFKHHQMKRLTGPRICLLPLPSQIVRISPSTKYCPHLPLFLLLSLCGDVHPNPGPTLRVLQWNANHLTRPDEINVLSAFLQSNCIEICLLQETRRKSKDPKIEFDNYNTYELIRESDSKVAVSCLLFIRI